MNNISLIKLETVHLYLDLNKKIITLEVLNSNYSKTESVTLLEYFKNFWILAKEQKVKYNLIIIVNHIGIYPLSFYMNLITYLNEIRELLSEHLIACCFLCKDNGPIQILKPLFSMYKFVRPYSICNTYEEVLQFFNKEQ
jgi:hypothetical protein